MSLVMTELNLITLGFALVMKRMSACVRVRLGTGILHNMLGGSTGGMVVCLVWSCWHSDRYLIESLEGLVGFVNFVESEEFENKKKQESTAYSIL